MNCAVIGAGAWGTALSNLLAHNGHDVSLWAFEPEVVVSINEGHENSRFLQGCELHDGIRASGDLREVVSGAGLVTIATPSHVTRNVARSAAPGIPKNTPVVVASKGIEVDTLALMSDVAAAEIPGCPIVALSGPSFASEVASFQPTAVVVASDDPKVAADVQRTFSSAFFRTYTLDDVRGVELGGSLKNVMAVATGIADGLGLGFNARAALITRGLAEMTRLGTALGASASTFAGLAGLGDLVLTCTGTLSRNRAVGVDIGKGKRLEEVLAGKDTVAEGVITTRSAKALADKMGIEMPIIDAVYKVLFEGQSPREAITGLMTRGLKAETD